MPENICEQNGEKLHGSGDEDERLTASLGTDIAIVANSLASGALAIIAFLPCFWIDVTASKIVLNARRSFTIILHE